MSCKTSNNIEGLWVITKVEIGDSEMTPNGRWIKFHHDGTQISGNGRFQHTDGIWKLNKKNKLMIEDTNFKNDYGSFSTSISDDKMIWTRIEDGQNIRVYLDRSNTIPKTLSDNIIGIWQLESSSGMDDLLAEDSSDSYLHFRWDKKFVRYKNNERIFGVYNVHSHKAEIELIPYGDLYDRSFYESRLKEDKLTIRLLNRDIVIEHTYKRIYEFPNLD